MNYIDSKTIRALLPYSEWIDTIEKALLLKQGADYIMPLRTHIDFDDNTLLLMPCIAEKYFSTKLVSLYPGNASAGKPPLKGMIVLNDRSDGEPLAILDGPAITAMRTAAVGGFAVRHLSPVDASALGVIGLGTQGRQQALFACSERKIKEITVFDCLADSCRLFTSTVNAEYPDVKINIAESTMQVCKQSEIIITATNSKEPVLPDDEDILRGKTFIGIGSYKKDMREFPDSLFRLADKIYTDTLHGLEESGDLIYPLENKIMDKSDFLEAGRLLKDKDLSSTTRVFKSVGMALFDLLASVLVYETSMKQGQHPV
ncbi:MAG: ornithine cyclodeaminase family protein [Bacteroidales bacterium]|nr:ornithine cyclodeaminase family protein [Bacteroidales bacterium]